MEVLPRICCSGLDALLASPVEPRLAVRPRHEELAVVGPHGEDLGTLDWCPVCGQELAWARARRGPRPVHALGASQAVPVAVVTPGSRFTVRAAGRAASGVVIGVGAQSLTCLVGLWLGDARDPRAGDPDVLTLSPVWPLSTGAWDIDGLELGLAGVLRERAVVRRPDPRRPGAVVHYLVGPTMQLSQAAYLPARAIVVHEPTELLATAA